MSKKALDSLMKTLGYHSVIYRDSDIRCKDGPTRSPTNFATDLLDVFNDQTRAIFKSKNLGPANTYTLYLRSVPLLWAQYLRISGGDHVVARQEILANFASHVQAVNNILAKTSFETSDGTIAYRGLQLAIARTKIMTKDDCLDPTPSPYCTQSLDADDFLNLISAENYDMFCLAYAFTYRDFLHGVIGLARIASAESQGVGGVCDSIDNIIQTLNG